MIEKELVFNKFGNQLWILFQLLNSYSSDNIINETDPTFFYNFHYIFSYYSINKNEI